MWCAVLDINCEPKYYIKEENAKRYIERAYEDGRYIGKSKGKWNGKVMEGVGWYDWCEVEDD